MLPSGLTANGLAVVDDALTHGVKLHGVNVMTMDFGSGAAPKPQGKMGAYCIQAATSLHGQLKILYKKHGAPRTDAQLWAMTGMTPMIGMNDVKTEVFTLADAKQVLTFGQNKQLGLLSFWSLNRDNPCPTSTTVQLKCSSSPDQKQAYEFTNIFKVYTSP